MPFGKRGISAPRPSPARRPVEAFNVEAPAHNVDEATLARIGAWRGEDAPDLETPRASAADANLKTALIVRAIIIFAAVYYFIHIFLTSGEINRLVGAGIFALLVDYGRVLRKALRSNG